MARQLTVSNLERERQRKGDTKGGNKKSEQNRDGEEKQLASKLCALCFTWPQVTKWAEARVL